MRIGTVIDRLRARTGLEVAGAAELAAVQADQQRDGAFVFYQSDSAADNTLDNAVRQTRRIGIGVALAVSNRRRRGAEGVVELETAREQVFRALLGWQPADAVAPVTFRSGRLVGFSKHTLWWVDEFVFTEFLSA